MALQYRSRIISSFEYVSTNLKICFDPVGEYISKIMNHELVTKYSKHTTTTFLDEMTPYHMSGALYHRNLARFRFIATAWLKTSDSKC